MGDRSICYMDRRGGFVLHNQWWRRQWCFGDEKLFFFATQADKAVVCVFCAIVVVHYLRTVDFFSLFLTPQNENGSNLIELKI